MKIKALLYCVKSKPYLEYKQIPRTLMEFDNSFEGYRCSYKRTEDDENFQLNGKIVAECDYEVEEIEHYIHYEPEVDVGIAVLPEFECDAYRTYTLDHFKLLEKSCLDEPEILKYLGTNNGYAIHIKNLHIFDEPKELSEFYKIIEVDEADFNENDYKYVPIEKAPQNMMYAFDYYGNPFVLISIKPEWLCKILNGEKTIEVRKKVLKGMLNND